MTALVCLGLGYCARFYVAEFGMRFDRVIGTSRSPDKKTNAAVQMLVFDGVHPLPNLREAISGASHLLISAAPSDAGDPVLAALADELRSYPGPPDEERASEQDVVVPLLLAAPEGPLSLISTTTVFGTPTDVTLSELALETFFPADAATADRLRLAEPVRSAAS